MRPLILVAAGLWTAAGLLADSARNHLKHPEEWYRSPVAREIGSNVLSWQNASGDWPKNTDTVSTARPEGLQRSGTFDNGATTGELRLLAKLYNGTGHGIYHAAFVKGLNLILTAQYPNGGWPQSYPPGKGYARHTTFNDDTFVRLAEFTRDVGRSAEFKFMPREVREKCAAAFERAVECVVKSQIRVDGNLTVWCAQHDESTLEPRPARSYELISLSGSESARLLRFLMSLENPSRDVREAIEAGVRWFESAKLTGIRQVRENGERRIISDNSAPPLWARFYEIGTNRPIFSGRDGVKKFSMDEIEAERRNGYAWYGNWGEPLLEEHRQWRTRHGISD